MSANERSLTTSSAMNTQGNTAVPSPANTGGPNQADEQTEPTSALSIFSIDYKK